MGYSFNSVIDIYSLTNFHYIAGHLPQQCLYINPFNQCYIFSLSHNFIQVMGFGNIHDFSLEWKFPLEQSSFKAFHSSELSSMEWYIFTNVSVFIKVMDFTEHYSCWWIIIKVMYFHQSEEFSSEWWIFMKLMNLHQIDELYSGWLILSDWLIFIYTIDFHQIDEILTDSWILIRMMNFHQSDTFSLAWWIHIRVLMFITVINFYPSDKLLSVSDIVITMKKF